MIIASFPFTGTANQVGSKFSADWDLRKKPNNQFDGKQQNPPQRKYNDVS
jgi:hypothetical protein